MGDTRGTIIILNGVSSAGKTTVAKALQEKLDEPFFWIANDTFCDMCPEKFWNRDWVAAINQSLTAMIYTIRTFSDLGFNTIVDQVFLHNDAEGQLLEKCISVLSGYPVVFVRVDCSIEELERREKARGDRDPGQAVSQIPFVHNHQIYDCVIDTSVQSPDENIEIIKTALGKPAWNNAFQQLKHRLDQTGTIYPV
jgi:chloramphenicol 3-O-phosphotransferase